VLGGVTSRSVGQGRFRRQPVKNGGFRGPGRLLPASGLSPTLLPTRPSRAARHLDVRSPSAVSRARARPPSPTPAATGMASHEPDASRWLLQPKRNPGTPPDRPRPHTSIAFAKLVAGTGCPASAVRNTSPEPKPRMAPLKAPHVLVGTPESACTQRCRGQLDEARAPHRHRLSASRPGKPRG
jgi:hypothetical protein